MVGEMKIVITRREITTRGQQVLFALIAIAASLLALAVILYALNVNPLRFYALLALSLVDPRRVSATLFFFIPIALCAIGSVVAYKAALWNIGQEGQFIVGAIAALGLAHFLLPALPHPLALFLLVLIGGLGGGFWSWICGVLRAFLGVNEAVTTLLLYYIAINILQELSYEAWKDPRLYGFPYTYELPNCYWADLPEAMAILAILVALYHVLMTRGRLGLVVKVLASGEKASIYMGFNPRRYIPLVMLLSGFTSGIAGALTLALQPPHRLFPTYFFGYGFSGLVASWLGALNVMLTIPASLFLAMLHEAASSLQIEFGVSIWFVQVVQGVVLALIMLAYFFTRYTIRIRRG